MTEDLRFSVTYELLVKTKKERKKEMTEQLEDIAKIINEANVSGVLARDLPDPGPCDESGFNLFFTLGFATEDMAKEIPAVLKAYLQQREGSLPDLSEYKAVFGDRIEKMDITLYGPDKFLASRCIILIFYDWKHGSSVAGTFLLSLYRRFYKEEYNILKKFSQIDIDTLMAFQDEHKIDSATVMRLLVMGEVMGKPLVPNIRNYYYSIALKTAENVELRAPKQPPHDENEATRWEKILNSGKYDKIATDTLDFLNLVAHLNGCSMSNGELSDDREEEFMDMLCVSFKDSKLSDETLVAIAAAAHMMAYTSNEMRKGNFLMHNCLNTFLSDAPTTSDPAILKLFKTEQPKEDPIENSPKITELEAELSMLKAENESLKKQLKAAKGESEWLSGMVSDLKSEIKDLKKNMAVKPEKKNPKTSDVRSSISAPTSKQPDIPLSEMKATIADRNIVIIGGHDNWLAKIRNTFPKWKVLGPAAVPNRSAVANADFILFFTDHTSHLTFNGYCDVARSLGIPFGYLHGVNINNNIKDIYSLTMEL